MHWCAPYSTPASRSITSSLPANAVGGQARSSNKEARTKHDGCMSWYTYVGRDQRQRHLLTARLAGVQNDMLPDFSPLRAIASVSSPPPMN